MNTKFNLTTDSSKFAGVLIAILILLFIYPWLSFWCCYFAGWVAKITIGKYLVAGFNYLGLPLVTSKIPLVAGTLGWIGSFFHSISSTNNSSC